MGNNCTVSLMQTMVSNGDAEALECLLRQSPRVADRPVDLYGNTTAMVAARLGCYHLIPVLVKFGCRLEAKNYTGQSVIGILMNRISMLSRQERASRERTITQVKGHLENPSGRPLWMNMGGDGVGDAPDGSRWVEDKGSAADVVVKRRLSNGIVADRECLKYVLRQMHGISYGQKLLNDALNRNLDTALMLAIDCRRYDLVPILLKAGCRVNQANRDGHTALDLFVYNLFPIQTGQEHVQLWQKPSSGSIDDWSFDRLPKVFRMLLSAGATGHSIGWFILHIMSEDRLIGELCRYSTDLTTNRLLGKLLLQTSVKYCQEKNLKFVLKKGVDLRLLWEPVSKSTCFQNVQVVTWDKVRVLAKKGKMGALCEHVLDSIKLPVNAAILLVRAASCPGVLRRIIDDLIRPIDPYDDFQTGKAIEIFYPYAVLCRTLPGTNLLMSLDDVCLSRFSLTVELQWLGDMYNLDLSEFFRRRCRVESLQKICKRCIRMNLRRSSYYGIDRLPLPKSLREYLKTVDH